MEKQMRKFILLLLLPVALLLAGCLPTVPASPTATTKTKANSTPQTNLGLPTQVSVPISADCTVKSLRPTPGPTPTSIYPGITSSDWSEGPEDARITLVEYGDFQ